MLLTVISEYENTPNDIAIGNTDEALLLVFSTDNSLVTKNEILRTAYFYRLTRPSKMENQLAFHDRSFNVAYTSSMELHRVMWVAHTSLVARRMVIVIKPSVIIDQKFPNKLFEILDAPGRSDNWGIIKGDHDKYFALNPKFSYVYKSSNIDDIVKCCKANELEVITDDRLIYDPAMNDLNYEEYRIKDFVHSGTSIPYFNEIIPQKIPFDKKAILLAGQTKNIVYHADFKKNIKPMLKKFEHSASFSTMEEFKDRLDKFPSDTTWVIGNFLTSYLIYFTVPLNEILLYIAKVLSLPESIIWAKLYHTPDEIHSTLKAHTLYKGPAT